MYWRIAPVLLLILMFTFILLGCGNELHNEVGISKPDEQVLEAFDTALVSSANEFGFELLNKLIEEDDNIFISPTSIFTALAMTYNGARGETKEAMAEVLRISDIELERLNENNLALIYLLMSADPSVKLQIANSLWMRAGIEFDKDFVERNEKYYNASVHELDFNNPKAADIINQWVNDNTNGLIEDIIEPPIDPYTILFLINAIYFQGDWSKAFDEDMTRDDTFFLPDGNIKNVPFMYSSDEFAYYEEESFQSLRIPYGDKERLAMYVFLPAQEITLKEFLVDFNMKQWEEIQRDYYPIEGTLQLPRFSMEYEKSLNDYLKAMGMEIAFEEGEADFLDMVTWEGKPNIYISEVKHKSYIDVHEKGTEAAAATSVEMRVESASILNFDMKVNRPFFFLIHDKETNAVLFMGTVVEPE